MTHHMQLNFSFKQCSCIVCIEAHAGDCSQILNVFQLNKTCYKQQLNYTSIKYFKTYLHGK